MTPKLSELVARYAKEQKVKPSTRRTMALAVERFDEFLGRPAYVPDLTDLIVADLVNHCLQNLDSPSAAANTRRWIATLWRWAAEAGIAPSAPDFPIVSRVEMQRKLPKYEAGASKLMQFAGQYAIERGIQDSARKQVETVIRKFERFAKRGLSLEDLNSHFVNRWLAAERTSVASMATLHRFRRVIMALWWHAYDTKRIDEVPRGVARVKVPRQPPRAWTVEEVCKLIDTANLVKGTLSNGIPRGAWLEAFIRTAFDTGLRRGDVLRLTWDDIAEDGTVAIRQEKTNWPITCRLSVETLAALERIARPERDKVLPWPYGSHFLSKFFRSLVTAAGVSRGTAKYIRRASATAVEIEHPGSAQRHLGHRTPGLAYASYVDPRQIQSHKPAPPTLRTAKRA